MNQSQRSYALGRIGLVALQAVEAITRVETVKERRLPFEEKFDLIQRKKVSFRSDTKISEYTSLVNAYDFSKYESKSYLPDSSQKKIAEIRREQVKAQDAIQLAGDQDALDAIHSFEQIVNKYVKD